MWILCWVVVWILVVWDVYLALDGTKGNTWSEVLRVASQDNAALPWLFGILVGHLFHGRDDLSPIVHRDAAQTLLILLTLVLGVVSTAGVTLGGWLVAITGAAGIGAGCLLWPKHRQAMWHW